MIYARVQSWLPGWLYRHLLHFDTVLEESVRDFAATVPPGTRVLDAGAGEARHGRYFAGHLYTPVDLAIGDTTWDYTQIQALADLTALPFRSNAFRAALNIVTL